MEKKVDVAIIGAGTAGLSAHNEIKKVTDNYVIINSGPYGTTCARIGCMPSKVLIQIANDFHRRKVYNELGITGGDKLNVNIPAVMNRVRILRDRFVSGVLKTIEKIGDKNINGFARFIEPTTLEIEGKDKVMAKKVIIATGSEPIMPKPWEKYGSDIITTDNFFEEPDFPRSMGIIGTGIIGLELGQALSRLGINITALNGTDFIGGLTDPVINDYAINLLKEEMNLVMNEMANIDNNNSKIEIKLKNEKIEVDKILVSMGRKPILSGLGLDKIGIKFDKRNIPTYNPLTMQIDGYPIYIAGDGNGHRPLLHEAIDEGHIAGYNAVHDEPTYFKRRVGLAITFSEPNIAIAGKRYSDLKDSEIIIGQASFESQGRAIVMAENRGLIRIYGDPFDGKILGAEMVAPSGEHLAHQIAWCIHSGLTVFEMLALPFYHPVIEEGMQNALRSMLRKVRGPKPETELMRCEGHPVDCLH